MRTWETLAWGTGLGFWMLWVSLYVNVLIRGMA